MNVLVVSPSRFDKGGISTVVKNLQSSEKKIPVTFHFYSTWKSGRICFRSLYCLIKLLCFPLFLSIKKVDVVYIHFAQDGSFYRKAIYSKWARVFRKRIIWHSHSSSFNLFFEGGATVQQKLIRSIFNNYCDELIVLGEYWFNFYSTQIGISIGKITILNNAVIIPKTYFYNSQGNVISMFGRLGTRKGTYDLIEVAQLLKDRDILFKLYGDGEITEVCELIESKQLKNIQVMGWVDQENKDKVMRESVLNILPSYNEGLPMAVLETMSFGVPNIATKVGSISEVITDGENGYIVEPGHVNGIVDKIEIFLKKTDDEKKIMSENARTTIRMKFSIEEYLEKLSRVLLN